MAIRAAEFGSLLLCSMLLAILSYTFTFSATWFYTRYFSPLGILFIVILGILLADAGRNWPRAMSAAIPLLTLPIVVAVFTINSGEYQSIFIKDQLQLTGRYVPPGDKVCSFQTGTLGYFRDNVINLDGKVNPDVLAYKRGDLVAYIEQQRIAWFCDEQGALDAALRGNFEGHGWKVAGRKGTFVLYHRESP